MCRILKWLKILKKGILWGSNHMYTQLQWLLLFETMDTIHNLSLFNNVNTAPGFPLEPVSFSGLFSTAFFFFSCFVTVLTIRTASHDYSGNGGATDNCIEHWTTFNDRHDQVKTRASKCQLNRSKQTKRNDRLINQNRPEIQGCTQNWEMVWFTCCDGWIRLWHVSVWQSSGPIGRANWWTGHVVVTGWCRQGSVDEDERNQQQ